MSREVALPARPLVPAVLPCLAVTIACERRVMGGAGAFGTVLMAVGLGLGLSLLMGLLVAAREGWGCGWRAPLRQAGAVLAGCLCCSLVGSLVAWRAAAAMAACADELSESPVSAWELVVAGDPSEGVWSQSCVADVVRDGRVWGRIRLSCDAELSRGRHLRCVGRFSPAGDDEWGRSCRARGICGSVRAVRVTSVGPPEGPLGPMLVLRAYLLEGMCPSSGPARALLAGLVLGDRSELSRQGLVDDFSRAGLAYLVAVSGAHIALVSALLAGALSRMEARPAVRAAALAGVGWVYVLLCGVPASAVRAWCMSVAAAGASLAGRRDHALSAVGVTGLVLCLLQPSAAGELGFVLSVSCVCGLCALGGYADYVLASLVPGMPEARGRLWRRLHHLVERAGSTLSASVVAQLSSLPLVAGAFGTLSLVGPVACLATGPLFVASMYVGLAAAALCRVPVVGGTLLSLADVPCGLLVACVRLVGRLPCACVPVTRPAALSGAVVALLAALLVVWPRLREGVVRRVLVALAVPVLAWQLWWGFLVPPRVVVLDVGQGDAILVQDGPHTLLVDAGPEGSLAPALLRNHVGHLDAVLVTHLHADHYAGLGSLVGFVGVDEVVVAEGVGQGARVVLSDELAGLGVTSVVEVSYGDVLRAGRFSARVVWPRDEVDGTENAHSIELLVEARLGGRSLTALLTGDAERDETGAVIGAGDVGDVDLLKVGHHGSEVSLTPEQAVALDAEVAVASAGAGNSYGHPDPACVEALEGAGTTFLCTIEAGDVEVRPGRAGPRVRCQRGRVPS